MVIAGVISDTHLTKVNRDLEELAKKLKGVDILIHLGDIVSGEVLDFLENLFQVKAVLGNMDSFELSSRLPEKLVIEIEGVKLGLIHGEGPPWGIEERVASKFGEEKLSAILFGHTHNPVNRVINGVLFFNPGSPTDKVYAKENTYGILKIGNGSIEGEIRKV